MNARHPMWDNNYTPHHSNSTGNRLNSFLSQDNDWHLLNFMMPNLTPTYFPRIPGIEPSVLDMGICNDYNLVESFNVVIDGILLSDHAPIVATLHSTQTSTPPQRYIWNTSRTDIPWDIFQTYLTTMLQAWRDKWSPYLCHTITFTQHDINTCWDELRQYIIKAGKEVIGKKRVSPRHKHWFTIDPNIPSHLYPSLSPSVQTQGSRRAHSTPTATTTSTS
jgi:hypothetical protein